METLDVDVEFALGLTLNHGRKTLDVYKIMKTPLNTQRPFWMTGNTYSTQPYLVSEAALMHSGALRQILTRHDKARQILHCSLVSAFNQFVIQ